MTRMSRLLRVLALGGMSVVIGCAAQGQPRTYDESHRTVKAKVGEQFRIVLTSNRTTGYTWRLAEPLDASRLKLINTDYVESKSGRLGAPGKQGWLIQAVGEGQTTVSLAYVRPWEKDVSPAKTANFHVTIVGGARSADQVTTSESAEPRTKGKSRR